MNLPPLMSPPVHTERILPWLVLHTCPAPGHGYVTACLVARTRAAEPEQIAGVDVALQTWTDSERARVLDRLGCVQLGVRNGALTMVYSAGDAAHLPAMIGGCAAAWDDATGDPVRARAEAARHAWLSGATPAAASRRAFYDHLYAPAPPLLHDTVAPGQLATCSAPQVGEARAGIRGRGLVHLLVVGQADHDLVRDTALECLSGWRPAADPEPEPLQTPAMAAVTPVAQHAAQWGGCHIRLGAPAPGREDDDLTAFNVALLIAGGAFPSRLVTLVREDSGLAYRITAATVRHLDAPVAVIEADCSPASAPRVVDEIRRCLASLASRGPTQAEVDTARRYVQGSSAIALSSLASRAQWLGSKIALDVDREHECLWHKRLYSLTVDDVRAAASRWLDPDRFTGIVQGGEQR